MSPKFPFWREVVAGRGQYSVRYQHNYSGEILRYLIDLGVSGWSVRVLCVVDKARGADKDVPDVFEQERPSGWFVAQEKNRTMSRMLRSLLAIRREPT